MGGHAPRIKGRGGRLSQRARSGRRAPAPIRIASNTGLAGYCFEAGRRSGVFPRTGDRWFRGADEYPTRV